MATKKKSTAKTAGNKKKAVMNSRNPKKPMAISGNTMNSDSMYKKGGRVKKYAAGGPGDPKPAIGTGDKVDMVKNLFNKYFGPKKSININNSNSKPEKKLLAKRGGKIKSKN